jgi:hypothetical protein
VKDKNGPKIRIKYSLFTHKSIIQPDIKKCTWDFFFSDHNGVLEDKHVVLIVFVSSVTPSMLL